MFDVSAQALKRLGLIRYIGLKLNYSINNLVVVTIYIQKRNFKSLKLFQLKKTSNLHTLFFKTSF